MKKKIPFMLSIVAIASIASITVLGNTQSAHAGVGGFSGTFDPSNWTEFTEGNGNVVTVNAPGFIVIEGSDNSFGCDGVNGFVSNDDLLGTRNHINDNCVTDYTIPMPCTGTVSFVYFYETNDEADFDPAGFLVNGAFTVLAGHDEDTKSGSQVVAVQQGDVFGFRVDSTDDSSGIGLFQISDFVGPDCQVGGEFLPIETTSLLLAAAQSPAAWLTTLTIAVLGIGAYVFTRNPNNMRNIKVILRDYLDRF